MEMLLFSVSLLIHGFSDALAMANEFLLTKSEVELSFDFSHLKMLISQNWYEKYILELHINFVPQTAREHRLGKCGRARISYFL